MNLNPDFLVNSSLLRTVPLTEVSGYLADGRFRVASYLKGQVIHLDGDVCTQVEVILTGTVSVERIDPSGDLLAITDLSASDILGGNLVFSKDPRYPMTLTAKSKTLLLGIPKDVVLMLCSGNKVFLESYLAIISDQAVILGDKIKHYVNKTIRESLMSFLLHESERQHSNRIELKMTKKALAERLGVQRTSLSRELQKMRIEGLLSVDNRFITIQENPKRELRI